MLKKKKIDKSTKNNTETVLNWKIEEYVYYERSKKWYIITVTLVFLMLIFSFLTTNFLFAMVIIIASLIIILHDGRKPDMVTITITNDEIQIGKKIILFEELKNFSIIYKPKNDIKNLYFEYKNSIKQRVSIPLKNTDPLLIREFLLKYLPEDLERTSLPLSETLAKILKL